ncbi:7,8-didemethyl-8-hydroxy-5-deazariboflavin synthase CofG [Microbacterium sp. NPDC055357]
MTLLDPAPARRADAAAVLDRVAAGARVDADAAETLLGATGDDFERLLALAGAMRDAGGAAAGRPGVITYSRKVFIPLTTLCRDRCHYCVFVDTPGQLLKKNKPAYMSPEQVLAVARQGAALGCKEALLTLGDRPEDRWPEARAWLDEHGYASTIDYVAAMARLVTAETGLLAHANPGVMTHDELVTLRAVSPSMGMMLETTSRRLFEEPGQVHYGSPDKDPALRLTVIDDAGRARVPFTTGILVGIGETLRDRAESLIELRDAHERHGHVQEVIVQNFRAKPRTAMQGAADAALLEYVAAVAVARLVMGPDMRVQVPPNLSDSQEFALLVRAGADDWGGVSPLTADHVNPERPWPHIDELAEHTATLGFELRERLTAHPEYVLAPETWLAPEMRDAVAVLADPETGLARDAKERSVGAEPRSVGAEPLSVGAEPLSVDAQHRSLDANPRSQDANPRSLSLSKRRNSADDPSTSSGTDARAGDDPSTGSGTETGTADDPSTSSGAGGRAGDDPSTGSVTETRTDDDPSTGSGTGGSAGDDPSTSSGTVGRTGHDPSTGSGTETRTGDDPSTSSVTETRTDDDPSTSSGTGGRAGDDPSTGSGTGDRTGDGPSTGSGTGGRAGDDPSTGSGSGAGVARRLAEAAASDPLALDDDDWTLLLEATGDGLDALAATADDVRRYTVGEAVTLVANRNLTSSGFRRGGSDAPDEFDLAEAAAIAADAWDLGATEICVQGLVPPGEDPGAYLDLARAIVGAAPGLHLHAYRPQDVRDLADRTGLGLDRALAAMREAGVGTVPGTGVKVLSERVRDLIAPGDLEIDAWTEAITAAHRAGFRSTSVLFYGHVETAAERIAHLRTLRRLQQTAATAGAGGGFSEFVPIPLPGHAGGVPLVADRAPLDEHRAMVAVSRLLLSGSIPHVQIPWTRVGLDVAAQLLRAGGDDLGGTLFDGRIKPAAGIEFGLELPVADATRVAARLFRPFRLRTTEYGTPTPVALPKAASAIKRPVARAGFSSATDQIGRAQGPGSEAPGAEA